MVDEAETAAYSELRRIVARLRAPDGCPWDREQTHASLRPHLIEEAYEVLATLDAGDSAALLEELGDLLFQILLHTQLAEEAGEFSMTDVLRRLTDKLVRRHPHVFGEGHLETADEVVAQWDQIKQAERTGRDDAEPALASVPAAMPALAYAQTLLRRAEAAGFGWTSREEVLAKLNEEIDELAGATSPAEAADEFGDILINLVNYARFLQIDAEEALREASHKFRRRFGAVERQVRAGALDLASLSREELLALWAAAKAEE